MDDGVEPEFRNEYAGTRVGKFMDDVVDSVYSELEGNMSIVDGHTTNSMDAAKSTFFKGSVVVDSKRMCVRAIKNTQTGALDLELFDPMVDEVNVLSASAAEWAQSGFDSLQGLTRLDKIHIIRWLTHEKLHRLRDRPNKVVYRGTMKSKDSLSLVTAIISDQVGIDPGVLSLRIFSPTTGVMTKVDATEADWKDSGFGAFEELNAAQQAGLVQWICAQRGYKFLNDNSGATTAFKGLVQIDGAKLLLKAKMRPTAEHPLQLLFFDPVEDSVYEIQLNRHAWSRIQREHTEIDTAVLSICREYVVWTHDQTDLALKQVTWNIPPIEPTAPQKKKEPDIPIRPQTIATRVSVRVSNQLCCLTLRPTDSTVEAKLLFLKSARTHAIAVDFARWKELGFGNMFSSPRDVRRAMCIEFANMIHLTVDGHLKLDERVPVSSDGAHATGRDDLSVVSLGTTTDGKSTIDCATVDSSVMSLVSWEGATGENVHPSKKLDNKNILREEGLTIGGFKCKICLKLEETSITVDLDFVSKEPRHLQIDMNRWSQLGFDDIWRTPPIKQREMIEEFAGMLEFDEKTDNLKINEFSKQLNENSSVANDDVQVVLTEWSGTHVQGTLENGDVLNIRFDSTQQPDLILYGAYIEADHPQPIAATLEFVHSEQTNISMRLSESQLRYFGYNDFWDAPDKRRRQIIMTVVSTLSIDTGRRRLRIYRHPAYALPNSSFDQAA